VSLAVFNVRFCVFTALTAIYCVLAFVHDIPPSTTKDEREGVYFPKFWAFFTILQKFSKSGQKPLAF
jgi:hypothetical protein